MPVESLISIVVPVYNKELYLSEAIKSVQAQSYTNWELWLIDDGSTDSSGVICDAFKREDARIHVEHTSNRGVSAARNHGMNLACGEWLLFLDADDLLEKNALSTLLAHAGNSDVICGSMVLYPDVHPIPLAKTSVVYPTLAAAIVSNENCFTPGGIVSSCAKLYKRSRITTRFNEELRHAEDFSFNLEHLPHIGNLCFLPDVVYRYRRTHMPSLDKRFWLDRFDVCKQILLTAHELFENNESVLRAFNRYFVMEICQYFITLSKVQSLSESERILVMQLRLDDTILRQTWIRQISLSKSRQLVWLCIKTGQARLVSPLLRHFGYSLWRHH